jgi:hypothetical protein
LILHDNNPSVERQSQSQYKPKFQKRHENLQFCRKKTVKSNLCTDSNDHEIVEENIEKMEEFCQLETRKLNATAGNHLNKYFSIFCLFFSFHAEMF